MGVGLCDCWIIALAFISEFHFQKYGIMCVPLFHVVGIDTNINSIYSFQVAPFRFIWQRCSDVILFISEKSYNLLVDGPVFH